MTWQITRDHIAEPEGPSRVHHTENHSRIPLQMAAIGFQSESLPAADDLGRELRMVNFRLLDDDGEVYYEGRCHDDADCLNQEAALDWGATDAGCTMIEVHRDGLWKQELA